MENQRYPEYAAYRTVIPFTFSVAMAGDGERTYPDLS
jgi:hypothetical protein